MMTIGKNYTMYANKNSKVTILFTLVGVISFFLADLEISTTDTAFLANKFFSSIFELKIDNSFVIFEAILNTVFIAVLAIFFSSIIGFFLALFFSNVIVRISLAVTRAIHELFWALIFLQIFGLNTLSALLAIIIPYSSILAKVYAEILEEKDTFVDELRGKDRLSYFLYTKIPDALPHLLSYTRYRFECALRSSAILGFVGITTLGYYLSSFFMQGVYSEVWFILILFYIIIATLKYWFNKYTIVPLLIASAVYLEDFGGFNFDNLVRFFTSDIVPYPIKNNLGFEASFEWFSKVFSNEILPGTINTIVLTQLSLFLTAILALMLFPLVSKRFSNKTTIFSSHIFLVVLRSTPEYILAYIFLQLFGASMLPAVLALVLHNGSIISHLIANDVNEIKLAPDVTFKKTELYSYEIVPRIYNQFLAFLFYRWEIIIRESAILGILGVATLGFFIDSAIADFKLDKMFLLLIVTALLNIAVDYISKKVREYLRLKDKVISCK